MLLPEVANRLRYFQLEATPDVRFFFVPEGRRVFSRSYFLSMVSTFQFRKSLQVFANEDH